MTHDDFTHTSNAADSIGATDAILRATVRGQVQGVFFRAFVSQAAEQLSIGGFVRNQPDGSVYIVARGDRARLEELLELLRQGPTRAQVAAVEYKWLPSDADISLSTFEVRR